MLLILTHQHHRVNATRKFCPSIKKNKKPEDLSLHGRIFRPICFSPHGESAHAVIGVRRDVFPSHQTPVLPEMGQDRHDQAPDRVASGPLETGMRTETRGREVIRHHGPVIKLAGVEGIEPPTRGVGSRRSTTELHPRGAAKGNRTPDLRVATGHLTTRSSRQNS